MATFVIYSLDTAAAEDVAAACRNRCRVRDGGVYDLGVAEDVADTVAVLVADAGDITAAEQALIDKVTADFPDAVTLDGQSEDRALAASMVNPE